VSLRTHVALLFSCSAIALIGSAHATDLTIRFNGKFVEPTCQWAAGDDNRVVALDDIDVSQLQNKGLAGAKTFSIGLVNCASGLTTATFTFSGTPDPADGLRYQNTGTAKDVAIELESASNGKTIGANGKNSARTAHIAGGAATLNLQAGYWRLGAGTVSPGTVKSVATVVATYN
jgi:type 1 fimbria pilin